MKLKFLKILATSMVLIGLPVSNTFAGDDQEIAASLLDMGRVKYHPDGEKEAIEGSVVPSLSMEEQIRPCLNSNHNTIQILVNVSGVQSGDGNVRVAVYGNNPDDFLVSGKAITRVDVPSHEGEVKVCIEVPTAGQYSMAVLHDRNANGRAEIFSEGFGFSNNPSIGFSVPDFSDVAFETRQGLQEMQVAMSYIFGEKQDDRRRRSRR